MTVIGIDSASDLGFLLAQSASVLVYLAACSGELKMNRDLHKIVLAEHAQCEVLEERLQTRLNRWAL
jgi:hypothetical protein